MQCLKGERYTEWRGSKKSKIFSSEAFFRQDQNANVPLIFFIFRSRRKYFFLFLGFFKGQEIFMAMDQLDPCAP